MPEEILTPPGLIEDPRPEEAKRKDYEHQEVAPAAVILNWDRGLEGAPIFSDRDQNGSGSCVAQASATALEVLRGEVISALPIYTRRWNKPGLGMYLQDAGNIIRHLGTTTESLVPSQRMTEEQMNKPVTVATPINGYLYAFPNIQDIDQIAEAIEVRRQCQITFYGTVKEYAYTNKPMVDPLATKLDCPHDICGIYYFKDSDGQKCILTKESWGPNNIRLRIMTESYLKARGTGAMYFIPPIAPPTPVKPKHTFQSQLYFAIKGYTNNGNPIYDYKMMNNYSVKMLQDILKYEGVMDIKITSTGNYLQATAKAVLTFQRKHKVAPESELNDLQGKRVGPKTIVKLNELYSK